MSVVIRKIGNISHESYPASFIYVVDDGKKKITFSSHRTLILEKISFQNNIWPITLEYFGDIGLDLKTCPRNKCDYTSYENIFEDNERHGYKPNNPEELQETIAIIRQYWPDVLLKEGKIALDVLHAGSYAGSDYHKFFNLYEALDKQAKLFVQQKGIKENAYQRSSALGFRIYEMETPPRGVRVYIEEKWIDENEPLTIEKLLISNKSGDMLVRDNHPILVQIEKKSIELRGEAIKKANAILLKNFSETDNVN